MSAMMPKASAAASMYSFSSQPKAVAGTRKKYREPGEVDTSMYRDPKETCITWDKRVHRGNTYSMHTVKAIKDALQDQEQVEEPMPRARRQQKRPSPFDMPLPEKERVPVDLTKHLVAPEVVVEWESQEAQTDEFLPEPPEEQYQPQKTGVDVHTQVEDGELFSFDVEVEPILDVIVSKTLEQSVMEVEEEHEIRQMHHFKRQWYHRQESMAMDWQTQVDEEWDHWREKEVIVKQKREEKRKEAQVLLKIQAMAAAKQHLSNIVPTAVSVLQEQAFPDAKGMAINHFFLPQLLGQVQQEVRSMVQAKQQVDEVVAAAAQERAAARACALEAQREAFREAERRRHEELQIRHGRIRILVDDGAGRVPVGPVQVSSNDTVEEVQTRVFEWLQANEKSLAEAWPWGVVLCIDGEPIEATARIFEAKVGQISMVPKPAPPAESPAAGGEDGNEGAGGEEGGDGG